MSADASPAGLEARAEFLLRLRARGIRELALLRVLESVPRETFVPHRYADLAARDVALPIACGQTMTEPFLVAKMVEALAPAPDSRVLEIGAGSGYATAILARLAAEVVALERYRTLARQAQARLDGLGIGNATVAWADALAGVPEGASFDRLIVHAALDHIPSVLGDRLAPDAVAVYALQPAGTGDPQRIVQARQAPDGLWRTVPVTPSRLRRLEPGLSRGL